MATTTLPPSALQLPNPKSTFPLSQSAWTSHKSHAPPPRATPEDSTSSTDPPPDSFDDRLSNVRLRYKSGTGKKAELRKTRKGKKPGSGTGSGSSGSNVFLPPVPLKEAVSGGLNVEFGFSPYSERVNGRAAILGLTALLLVELATGKGVIEYHSASIVFIQVYFVAAACALYVKFEKEKVSVWPQSQK